MFSEKCPLKVPFFFKQWGGIRKSDAGRTLDGKTYDEFPRIDRQPALDSNQRAALMANLSFLKGVMWQTQIKDYTTDANSLKLNMRC